MFKRIFDVEKLFGSSFERLEDGYLFFPWRWGKGYWVSPDEYADLKLKFQQLLSWPSLVSVCLIPAIILPLGVLAAVEWGWWDATYWAMALTLAIFLFYFWQALAPQRLVFARDPIAPRRSKEAADQAIAGQIPWLLIIGPIVLLALQLWLNWDVAVRLFKRSPIFASILVMIFIVGVYLAYGVARVKWRQREN
ncbi:MAG: hypothetical protein A3J40_05270 [Erythrobacter sp. RIFCSPHIGHO2_12_FULL_63_10]|nr:MAG: hypothetical protein A3J40_05270 [Erythrobacter sp. RIFCSPHIGHO2_12_FULL_63_10]